MSSPQECWGHPATAAILGRGCSRGLLQAGRVPGPPLWPILAHREGAIPLHHGPTCTSTTSPAPSSASPPLTCPARTHITATPRPAGRLLWAGTRCSTPTEDASPAAAPLAALSFVPGSLSPGHCVGSGGCSWRRVGRRDLGCVRHGSPGPSHAPGPAPVRCLGLPGLHCTEPPEPGWAPVSVLTVGPPLLDLSGCARAPVGHRCGAMGSLGRELGELPVA